MNAQEQLLENLSSNMNFKSFQHYIHEIMIHRGFNNQTPQEKMMLLIEEIGELAKALRKNNTNLAIDYKRIDNYDSAENEIADTLIVLFSLCDLLGIDIEKCILSKESINVTRTWKK